MRAFNRILCLLLAAAIATAGVLAVIEIIAANTDNDPVVVKWRGLVDDLTTTEWKTGAPRVVAIVLIIVGLLLLFFALRRGKPSTVPLTTNASATDMTTTRKSLQRSLSTLATSVDGVADAKAKVKRRKIVVSGRAGTADRDGARSRLESEMQERIDGLSLADKRRLKVKLAPAPEKRTPETASGLDDTSTAATSSSGSADSDRTPVSVGGGSERGSDQGSERGSDSGNAGGERTDGSNPVPGFGPGFGSRKPGSGTNPGGTS
jgi:hypothetical protein